MLQDVSTKDLIDSTDELQRRVLEEFGEHIRRCEEEAAETGRAVRGDFMVGDDEGDEPILRVRFLCEPRKEARVLSVEDSTGHELPPAVLQ
jgi:hypothetical protein